TAATCPARWPPSSATPPTRDGGGVTTSWPRARAGTTRAPAWCWPPSTAAVGRSRHAPAAGATSTPDVRAPRQWAPSAGSAAARRKPEIIAISRSAEMAPYRIGGSYDRPIARRLLEEAGVPRQLFGQKKRAMALVFSWGPGYLSDTARTRFEGFLRSKRKLWR